MIRSLPTIFGLLIFAYLAMPTPHAKAPPPSDGPPVEDSNSEVSKIDNSIYELSLATEAEANQIFDKIANSEEVDFSAIAKIISKSESSANGGLIGTFNESSLKEKFGDDLAKEFSGDEIETLYKPKQVGKSWIIYLNHVNYESEPPVFTPIPVSQRFECRWFSWLPYVCTSR